MAESTSFTYILGRFNFGFLIVKTFQYISKEDFVS